MPTGRGSFANRLQGGYTQRGGGWRFVSEPGGEAVVSVEQFIEGLTTSGLMTAAEVHALLVSLPPDIKSPTVVSLAAELVRRGKLTRYQASRIAAGRPHGLVLGKYVIQDKIGEGGMGEVFIAEHRRMKRPVVVKILPESATASATSIRGFEREVEAAAQLSHPNIVTAFDADEENGIHFLVMEYVEGEPLGDLVSRCGPLPVDMALSCILQAAMGLQYAHSKGIVHRDIKPNNLLLDAAGVVKILDMGLARFDDGRAAITVRDGDGPSSQNQIMGTVEYMSPEQVDNSSLADRRSDIYSLGCTLFRLLTNRPPYQGETIVKTLLAHRLEPIPSLAQYRSDIPEKLDAVFQRMVQKRPADRFQTMEEVILALQECQREIVPAIGYEKQVRLGDRQVSETETTLVDVAEADRALLRAARTMAAPAGGSNEPAPPAPGGEVPAATSPAARPLPAVGIDLGTTFSVIALLDEAGRPRVLANAEGEKLTPSAVLLEEDGVIVGKEASKAMVTEMERVAESAKRDLGNRAYRQRIAGRAYPPEVIQAWVLRKLRQDAGEQIGAFHQAVITVPAYFDEVRRKATMDAGSMAGIEVLDIINEPTAAALAFGLQHSRLDAGNDALEPARVLVYDLGGGTFDVTVMEIGSGEFVTLATDGDVHLGGRDWDLRLVDYAAEAFLRKHGVDPRAVPNSYGRLLRECEEAKRTLSARAKAVIACECQGHAERIEVTRQQFQDMTRDLLERTAFTTRHILQAAGMTWEQIDRILLVGGSTRMPAVVEMLRQMSGKEPDASVSPDEAVAQGAAIFAGFLLDRQLGRAPRVRVRNVNSHSLGLVATDPRTSRRQTAFLIPRNTPLPAKAKRVFRTLKEGQRAIVLQIVEGESADPQECTHIGKCTVRNLPADLPAGTPIEVRFQYCENGRLSVHVSVQGVAANVAHEIRRENNLSQAELDAWRRWVCGLSPAPPAEVQAAPAE